MIRLGDFTRSESEYEFHVEELEAERLALESFNLENNDFREAVYDALFLYNESIEEEDHILSITYEYSLDGNDIEFERILVYYYIDDDEDEAYKARFYDLDVSVDDLDFDDLSEADVDESYFDDLEVKKVYEL